MVKGIVLNRFCGKLSLLKPALDFLEQKTGKPVVGVIPLMEISIPEEDSLGQMTIKDKLKLWIGKRNSISWQLPAAGIWTWIKFINCCGSCRPLSPFLFR